MNWGCLQGILSGYVVSDREYHQTTPAVWFVPLGIGFVTYTKYFNIGAYVLLSLSLIHYSNAK